MTTVIGRSGAASRPRRRVLAVVLAPAHERRRHRLGDALDPERPRGAHQLGHARAGDLAHDLGGEDLARRRRRRTGGWRRSPASRRGRRPRTAARRRRCRCAPRGRRPRRSSRAACATAQRTAATALEKVTISPSPVDLTSRPSCAATTSRSTAKCRGAARVGLVVAVAVVERRRADDVGEHDRDERALHRRGASSPLAGGVSPQRVNRARRVHPRGMTAARPRAAHPVVEVNRFTDRRARKMMRTMSRYGGVDRPAGHRHRGGAERARRCC